MGTRIELTKATKILGEEVKEKDKDIRLEILPPDKYDDVLTFLWTHFFPDENVYKSFGVTRNQELDMHKRKMFQENISIIAVCEKSDQIVGATINGILKHDEKEDISNIVDPKYRALMKFEEYGMDEIDLFNRFSNVEEVCLLSCLAVHKDCRGKGIGKSMATMALILVRKLNFKAAIVASSTRYSKQIFEGLGFELLFDRKYDEWIIDGKSPFTDTNGDQSETVYGIKL